MCFLFCIFFSYPVARIGDDVLVRVLEVAGERISCTARPIFFIAPEPLPVRPAGTISVGNPLRSAANSREVFSVLC